MLAREAAQGDLGSARRLVEVLEHGQAPRSKGSCARCGSSRMAMVEAETSRTAAETSGEVWAGVGRNEQWCFPQAFGLPRISADSFRIAWCLDCGTMRGKFPRKPTPPEKPVKERRRKRGPQAEIPLRGSAHREPLYDTAPIPAGRSSFVSQVENYMTQARRILRRVAPNPPMVVMNPPSSGRQRRRNP